MTDYTVLDLYTGSVLLTVGGLVVGSIDLTRRVRDYRKAVAKAAEEASSRVLGPVKETLKDRLPQLVAADLRAHVERTASGFDQLAKAAGVKITSWRLWVSVAAAIVGVLMGGAADLLATVRAS